MPANGDRIDGRLSELGIVLPEPPRPLGRYVPAVSANGLVLLSGMGPVEHGRARYVGVLGESLTVDDGRHAARMATLNALAVLRAHRGGLAGLHVVRLAGYLRATADFTEHPRVLDGASELLADVFGPEAPHARLVFGVTSLPAGMCLELEVVVAAANA